MTTRCRPKNLLILAAVAMATLTLVANSAHAQTVLVDEDFQGGHPNNTANPAFPGWTWANGAAVKSRTQATNDLPGPVGDEGIQFEWTNANGTYDVTHNWAADDMYTLTLNASQQAWNGTEQSRFIDVVLLEDNGTELWNGQAEVPTQAGGVAWNGPGHWGDGPWTDELTFSWEIDASTFTTGNAGEEIDLRVSSSGDRGLYFDNVSLTLPAAAAVPEPASIAIWSLLGLCLAGYGYRRRR